MKTIFENVDSILYLLLTVFIMWVLNRIMTNAAKAAGADAKKVNRNSWLLFAAIMVYCAIIGPTGFLSVYSLPPRFLLFLVLPAFAIIIVVVRKLKPTGLIDQLNPETLVLFQSFRVFIESIFVISVSKGHLHKEVTIEGYNVDLVYALLTLGVYFLFRYKIVGRRFVFYWNVLGLAVIAWIIYLFVTTLYFPKVWGWEVSVAPRELGIFPSILVPMFLMPAAVFVHVLTLMKLDKDTE